MDGLTYAQRKRLREGAKLVVDCGGELIGTATTKRGAARATLLMTDGEAEDDLMEAVTELIDRFVVG